MRATGAIKRRWRDHHCSSCRSSGCNAGRERPARHALIVPVAGVPVEQAVTVADLSGADEIWMTGTPAGFRPWPGGDRALPPGPAFRQARELCGQFVETCRFVEPVPSQRTVMA